MMFANKLSRRAFTLIELLVVIVVIAVLAAIVIPKFASQGKRSKEAALRSNMSMVRTALASCQADTGLWPATLADLALTATPSAQGYNSGGTAAAWPAGTWHGPYVDAAANTDPITGTALTYVNTTGVLSVPATLIGNDTGGVAYSTY